MCNFLICTSNFKISEKRRKRVDTIKRGETRGQIDDIIHNSSFRQSDSAFLTEFGAFFKNAESD